MTLDRLKALPASEYIGLLRGVMHQKGYAFFTEGAYNLNLVGVRRHNQGTNEFDDLFSVVYRESAEGPLLAQRFACTTDPGEHWLRHPMNAKGTAVLVPGQYRRTYKIDLHGGRYSALCQRGGAVRVYRDGDRDAEMDLHPGSIETGEFGINIHRGHQRGITEEINRYSAGCQVIQDAADFDELMVLARQSRARWGEWFTYTLLEASDF